MPLHSSSSTIKSKKPKVLFYIKNLNGGGAERCVVEVLKNIDHTKFECKLLLGEVSGDYLTSIRKDLLLNENFTKSSKKSIFSIFERLAKRSSFKGSSFLQGAVHLVCLLVYKCILKIWIYHVISRLRSSQNISITKNTLYSLIRSHRFSRVRNSIINYEPDIVVSNLLESGSAIVYLVQLSLSNKKQKFFWVAVEQNNTLDRLLQYYPQPQSYTFWHFIAEAVYREVNQVIAVSHGIQTGLVENFNVCADKIRVIHNPVNLERFKIAHPLLSTQPYILAAGRLHPQKGFDMLIDAYATISHCVNANLVILGKGEERKKLEDQIRILGLADKVFLPGFQDNLESYMKSAKCFVMSSRYEGFGNVLIEAMAASCPVISFDCDYGPSEIIDHMKTGLLVPSGNVKELAQTMKLLLTDKTLADNLSSAALAKAEGFESSHVASAYEAVFSKFISP